MLNDLNCEFGVKLVKINEIENVTYYMAEEVEYSELQQITIVWTQFQYSIRISFIKI